MSSEQQLTVSVSGNWYAIYTKTNAEHKLKDSILSYCNESGISFDIYLPTTTEVKQWSDRKVTKNIPLFKNYLFIKHDINGFSAIKKMPGFADYVRFGRYPSVITQQQISLIATILGHQQQVICLPKSLVKGDPVIISQGPFAGSNGFLLEDQRQSKVAIEIRNFNQCLQVVVPFSFLQRVKS